MNRRNRVLLIAVLALLLVAAIVVGVTLHDRDAAAPTPSASTEPTETAAPSPTPSPEEAEETEEPEESETPEETASPEPEQTPEAADTLAPTAAPTPTPAAQTVSVTIVCHTALASSALPDGVRAVLPAGGVLLQRTVALEPGDTVWSLTQRVCREAGVSVEATFAAAQSAVYVEGIGQLYEFDCGEGSGWIYKVNGVAPGRGCDGYTLQPGDTLVWAYTCNYGYDV